jgi:hypothetical protein
MEMYVQKVICRKTFLYHFYAGVLQDPHPHPHPDPDPLIRGMDPRIRIRIHTKMSWIRKIALHHLLQGTYECALCIPWPGPRFDPIRRAHAF